MKILNRCMLLLLIVAGTSCKKEHDPNNENPQSYVLKAVEYEGINAKTEYTYDADGLLHEMTFSEGGSTVYTTSYDFLNGFIKKISVSTVLFEQTYSYLNGNITSILLTQLNNADRGDRLLFSYNANGTVSELKHYVLDIAGEHLETTSAYEYGNSGRLAKVVSVNADSMVEWNIESYSAECVFMPFIFIKPKIDEAYEIFNYPVLNKLKQLPAKISKRVHPANRNPYVQKNFLMEFVIQDKRIDKATIGVAFPESPGDNFSNTAIFKY